MSRLNQSYLPGRLFCSLGMKPIIRLIGGSLLIVLTFTLFASVSPQPAIAQTNNIRFELDWSSDESDNTWSVAWGDYDGDGDLDLAVGNDDFNLLYRNDGGALTTSAIWSSVEAGQTSSVAWGDYDGDGDLDLAVGNDGPNRLYRNDDGVLTHSAVWSSDERDETYSIAWGDYDGDGDLDLAVGNFWEPNRLYRNDDGALTASAVWSSDEWDRTSSVAWGDYDGDGDLDLAVGNGYYGTKQSNRLYRNDDGMLTDSAVWSSDESESTFSVAWGDYDGDGDFDLAVGNWDLQSNRLYRNDDGMLTDSAVWSSDEADDTFSVAWGDVDGDGDLDLAVGNDDANRIYRNDGGTLTTSAVWSSAENDATFSVAWGDYDGDGDLDLAVGNWASGPNRVYRNDGGGLVANAVWSSAEGENTESVAWGDYDNDGDLDLIVGNNGEPNRLYRNNDGVLGESVIIPNNAGDGTGLYSTSGNEMDNRLYRNFDLSLISGTVFFSFDAYWDMEEDWDYGYVEVSTDGGDTWDTLPDLDGVLRDSNPHGNNLGWGLTGSGEGRLRFDLSAYVGMTVGIRFRYRTDAAVSNPGWWIDNLSLDDDTGNVYSNDLETDFSDWINEGWDAVPTARDGVSIWSSVEADRTSSVAWGDYDGDSDLDLAVGNDAGPNRLYRNDGGTLMGSAVWSSDEADETSSLAWGDYDGDGDLDLVVGNVNRGNRLYRNDGGVLTASAVWSSVEADRTYDVAWGDYDGDGDLDLAVGNGGFDSHQPNRLYRNAGGVLTGSAVWSSDEVYRTYSVTWGDYDGDGDLDLAAGDFNQLNRLYRNDGGTLTASAVWSSDEADRTMSVAWSDYDGDGDLDLAVGNSREPNRLYRNDGGVLTASAVWSSDEADRTWSVAWGDYDGDGDFDLAVGNYSKANRVYYNLRRSGVLLVDNPPYVTISRPGPTDDADFFSTPHIIQAVNIPIAYTLFDPEEDVIPKIFPEFSPNGGGQWLPATPGPGGDGMTNLAAFPDGTPHTFVWNAEADLIKSDNVIFRIRAQPNYTHSPILWPAVDGKSPSFRVEAAPWYVKVVNQDGNAVEGAIVYYDGQLITRDGSSPRLTDRAGLLRLDSPVIGKPLVALAQQTEQPTVRAVHDGWAYRTYLTNLTWDGNDQPQPFFVSEPGEQRLVVRRDSPLVLFNIVVSIEWDADVTYLQTISNAFGLASDYLYDVTDGQMAFGQVTIYDNGEYWADADFQFSTKNTVRPYAFVGGLTSTDEAHAIRVGRFWDGGSGNRGNWNEPDGYRTLIHELGHYALYLYDEYFIRQVDSSGHFIGELPAACTSDSVRENSSDATNASIMFYQYNASELPGMDRWTEDCQNTEQQRVNGQADWQTVLAHYGGAGWTLNTPTSRGSVMAGPDEFPAHLLPFPEVVIHNGGATEGTARQLTVLDPQSQAVHNALVALYTLRDSVTIAIDQGLTDGRGEITVYGAAPGDTIRAATFDGAYAGAIAVGSETSYQLTLSQVGGGGLSAQDAGQVPYLSMTPQSDGDGLYLQVAGLEADSPALDAIVVPGEGGGSPQWTTLVYSPIEEAHVGTVSLSGVGLGSGRVRVSGGSLPTSINSDYNLQWVDASEMNDLYSEDGNFQLHLPPDSLLADAYATVLPTGYVPGPLPGGRQVMGSAYDVRLSGAVTELERAGVVKLHYHPGVMGVYTDTLIYHWSAAEKAWQEVGGEPSEVDHALSTTVTRLGIYALMGEQIEVQNRTYLPVILKQ